MVTLNVPKFATATVTLPAVVTLDSAIVQVVPDPERVPFVTAPVLLVMVMSLAVMPVTGELNVRTMPVLSVVPLVPPVCAAANVTGVSVAVVFLYTFTVLGDPEMLYPTGLVTPTDTVPSVITADKAIVQFAPDPLRAPLTALPVPSVMVM